MSDDTFEVILTGEVKQGMRRSAVEQAIRSRLKLSRRESRNLFSGEDRVLKRTAHQATAEQFAGLLEEAGAVCELRHSTSVASAGRGHRLMALNQTERQLAERDPSEQTTRTIDMRKTLRRFFQVPIQTATGSWLSVRLPRPQGAKTGEFAAVAAAMSRLASRHHRTGRAYAIGRVVGGSLMAVPTAGIALGVGAGMLLDGAVVAGLLNLFFFGSIAAYGLWLVVTGVRYARGLRSELVGATPAPASGVAHEGGHDAHQSAASDAGGGTLGTAAAMHPSIRSFMEKKPRLGEDCTFGYRGTHLWGASRERRCENILVLLAAVAACLFAGFWLPDFLNVAFGLLVLILVAVGLSRLTTKPPRQFHVDLGTSPPLWFSNDDDFWQPVMTFFQLRECPRRRFWAKRRGGHRAAKSRA
ncbi:MAG: hypothetical protein QNK18_16425 [Gammaproteobacteria bacterium]|nr:hypothetical protein [Gammaproteobacteria bacterium]